jgi:eukaryotic-like serine/threonine-protein kinase
MVTESSAQIWREALERFDRLLGLASPDRTRELAQLARSRPDLYPRVLTLLRADQSAEARGFLAGPAVEDMSIHSISAGAAVEAGARFGSYELERQLGCGGMGDVWLARRIDGRFDGVVALKVLHAHVAQSSARERFVREGKILGQLSHPHIARLLDAGATPPGVLYLVLEYVEGESIDRWCDERCFDIEARLQLFLQVCQAVSHAHTHLVIHRDLKPANILVTPQADIKLLDFGIAKLVDLESPAEETELTRLSGRALTPDFAAPEQILGQPITTATDVYALGVLLYLLLSGRKPYRRQDMSLRELERCALDTQAVPLSRVTLVGDGAGAIAELRRTTPQKLKRVLTGDLEMICAKAMRPEGERRYTSVEQLSADIERYLNGRPVLAARDSWAYRARKFVTRHVVAVSVSAAIASLAGGFAIAMSIQVARTARERVRAEQVSGFLVDLFELSDPYKTRGNEVTARELLDRGAQRIETQFATQPATRAALLSTVGKVYERLGLTREAQPLLEKALAGLVEAHGPVHPEIAATLNDIGEALLDQGMFEEARARLEAALSMRRDLLGADDPAVAETLMDLGKVAQDSGDPSGAERYFRDSLATYSRIGLGASSAAADVMGELANLTTALGRFAESVALLEAAVRIDRPALGADYPRVIMETHNLAFALQSQGRFAEAEPLFLRSNEQLRRVLGPEHPSTIDALSNYGRFLRHKGDFVAAEQVLRNALELNLRVHQPDEEAVGTSQVNLATALHDLGRLPEAEAQFRTALATYDKALPPNHPFLAAALSGAGRVLVDEGRMAEALPLLRHATEVVGTADLARSPIRAMARISLGIALVKTGAYQEAAPFLEDSYPIVLSTQSDKSAVVRQARAAQSELVRIQGNTARR